MKSPEHMKPLQISGLFDDDQSIMTQAPESAS
jgi:hypothetical protein